jgi:hypothetical protein
VLSATASFFFLVPNIELCSGAWPQGLVLRLAIYYSSDHIRASEGRLWKRWEVLAMSINQSQPRFDFTQSSFIADFTESQQSRSFLRCSVIAPLRRVLQAAREACSTPVPRICAESSPNAAFLSRFPPSQKQLISSPAFRAVENIKAVLFKRKKTPEENHFFAGLPSARVFSYAR